MARQLTQRVGIPGVRVIDTDVGAQQLAAAITQTAGAFYTLAKEGIANQRTEEAIAAARAATLERAPNGDLIAPEKTADTAIPSIYSQTYDAVMQKRYLNEMGLAAGEEFARLHNENRFDPDSFRLQADAYIKRITEAVPDWAFEAANKTLKTYASQHFTNIANQAKARDWEDARQYFAETAELHVNDIAMNARNNADPAARQAQHDMSMGLLIGELEFALDEKLIDQSTYSRILDIARRSAAAGSVSRSAREVLRTAAVAGEVDTLAAKATSEAMKNLPQELYDLVEGGEQATRQFVADLIQFEAQDYKIELAYQDMLENRQWRDLMLGWADQVYSAAVTGRTAELWDYAMRFDPQLWRDADRRNAAAQIVSDARGQMLNLDSMFTTSRTLDVMLEREFKRDPALFNSLSSAAGIPIDETTGKMIRDDNYAESPEKLARHIRAQRDLLALIPSQGAAMSQSERQTVNFAGLVYQAMATVADQKNEDLFQVQQGVERGDPDAIATMNEIVKEVQRTLPLSGWTPSQQKQADEAFLSYLMPPNQAAQFKDSPFIFGTLVDNPQTRGKALNMIEFAASARIPTASQENLLASVATTLQAGQPAANTNQLGAALMLWDRMRRNPAMASRMDKIGGAAKLNALVDNGYRGYFDGQSFGIIGDPARAGDYAEKFSRQQAEDMIAFRSGGEEKAATPAMIEKMLTKGWNAADPDNMTPLFLQDILGRLPVEAAMSGRSQQDVLDEWAGNNFYALGYGKSNLVRVNNIPESVQEPIVEFAPTSLIKDPDEAQFWPTYDRVINQVLAERFSDRLETTGQVGRDYEFALTVSPIMAGEYVSDTGKISPRSVWATVSVQSLRTDGMLDFVYGDDGTPLVISYNELVEEAYKRIQDQRYNQPGAMREAFNSMRLAR